MAKNDDLENEKLSAYEGKGSKLTEQQSQRIKGINEILESQDKNEKSIVEERTEPEKTEKNTKSKPQRRNAIKETDKNEIKSQKKPTKQERRGATNATILKQNKEKQSLKDNVKNSISKDEDTLDGESLVKEVLRQRQGVSNDVKSQNTDKNEQKYINKEKQSPKDNVKNSISKNGGTLDGEPLVNEVLKQRQGEQVSSVIEPDDLENAAATPPNLNIGKKIEAKPGAYAVSVPKGEPNKVEKLEKPKDKLGLMLKEQQAKAKDRDNEPEEKYSISKEAEAQLSKKIP